MLKFMKTSGRHIYGKRRALVALQALSFFISAVFFAGLPLLLNPVPGYAKVAPFKPPSPHDARPDKRLSRGKFLVASRTIGDPRFAETVILIVDYGTHGAVGIIVNRPTNVTVSEALPQMPGLKELKERLFFGGPVEMDTMLLLLRAKDKPENSLYVFSDVYVSSSAELLKGLTEERPSATYRVFAGYAGWAPGQLENELSAGAWDVIEAKPEAVFDKSPADLWQRLSERGVET